MITTASRSTEFSAMLLAHAGRNHEETLRLALLVRENPPDLPAHIETLRCYGWALARKGAYERALIAYREMELLCQDNGGASAHIPMAYQVAVYHLMGMTVAAESMLRILKARFPEKMDFINRIIHHARRNQ